MSGNAVITLYTKADPVEVETVRSDLQNANLPHCWMRGNYWLRWKEPPF